MIIKERRGQTESLSIGVIFSIIVVIALISVSVYVVITFIGIGKCADLGLFKDNFQDAVDRAWSSEITNDVFTGRVPDGIESICFSEQETPVADTNSAEYRELRRYFSRGNLFFYPPKQACDQPYTEIEHIDLSELGWHCFPVNNGEVKIGLEKGSFDSLVRIRESGIESSSG